MNASPASLRATLFLTLLAVFRCTGASTSTILQCPLLCYCDSISRYVHCEGDPTNTSPPVLNTPVPRYTERLELSGFQIKILTWEITRGIFPPALTELSIRKSVMTDITNGSLTALASVSRLDLSYNYLRAVQQGSFDDLTTLRHLDMSWNELKEVQGLFERLQNVETLDLSHNELHLLSGTTFSGLQRIQWLDISYNLITAIEPGTFLPMPALERLVLGHNPLLSLQRLEFLGARLRYMDVSVTHLSRAPESLGRSVRELRAAGNNMMVLQRGDLESYPSLTLLDLSDNRLVTIEDDVMGRLEYLSRLWLSNNQLRKIPRSLPRSLRMLYLDRNLIDVITLGDLQGLPRLTLLSLRENKIKEIETRSFGTLQGLRRLDLALNFLTSPPVFGPNTLDELDLSDNQNIEITAEGISSLRHLRVIHLANITKTTTKLRDLVATLPELSILNVAGSPEFAAQVINKDEIWVTFREINMQNTSLTTLPDLMWSSLGKLRELHLGNNPWNCSNDLQYKLTHRDKRLRISDSDDLKCAYPESLRGSVLQANLSLEVTPRPSLAPTRVQIEPPSSPKPSGLNKPKSTAPLNQKPTTIPNIQDTIENEVAKPIFKRKDLMNTKEEKINFSSSILHEFITELTAAANKTNNIKTTENISTENPSKTIPSTNTPINKSNPSNITEVPEKNSTKKTNITPVTETTTEKMKTTTKTVVENISISATTQTSITKTTEKSSTTKVSTIETSTGEMTTRHQNNTAPLETTEGSLIPDIPEITEDSVLRESPVDYEELTSVVEPDNTDDFYDDTGNYSELNVDKAMELRIDDVKSTSNVPIGFLSVLGACILGAVLMLAYQCRQQQKRWHRLRVPPVEEEAIDMSEFKFSNDVGRW